MEREYHGTVGAGVLIIARDTKKILLGLRSDRCHEPGTWNLFGGAVDPTDTNFPAAVLRELDEETCYSDEISLTPISIYKKPNFQYHNFIGLVPKEFIPKLNFEHDKANWFTFDEVLKLKDKHYGLIELLNDKGAIINQICEAL